MGRHRIVAYRNVLSYLPILGPHAAPAPELDAKEGQDKV